MRRAAKLLAQRTLTPLLKRWRGAPPELEPERWGLEVTEAGRLAHAGLPLSDLRERWGSPLHVVFADRLRRNAEEYLAPGAQVFYSYKTNPVPGVLRLLHESGVGAEVISEYELWLALRLEVPPERIIFNGPAKSPASIRTAIERDLLLLNINHREEVGSVASAARQLGRRPRIGVRVSTSAGWSGQFGSAIWNGEAARTAREAHETGVLDVCAIHAHPGGMLRSREQIQRHAEEVLAFADHLHSDMGIDVTMLDLGGSLATPTVAPIKSVERRLNSAFLLDLSPPLPEETLTIREHVEHLLEIVDAHYRGSGRPAPRLLLEPGRSMTGNCQVLLASVVALKTAVTPPGWAILDAGINVAEPMRSEYHHVFVCDGMRDARKHPVRLAGPICSPGDVLRWSVRLPELRVGDALAFMDTGAYFVPFSTSFSFPRPAIAMLDSEGKRLLRRAETFQDIIALDS